MQQNDLLFVFVKEFLRQYAWLIVGVMFILAYVRFVTTPCAIDRLECYFYRCEIVACHVSQDRSKEFFITTSETSGDMYSVHYREKAFFRSKPIVLSGHPIDENTDFDQFHFSWNTDDNKMTVWKDGMPVHRYDLSKNFVSR